MGSVGAWFHPEVAGDPATTERVIQVLGRVMGAGEALHPKIKALKGPWPDTRRLRIGRERALFSWRVDERGNRVAWVHEVGWRREVYERDAGLARAKAWVDARDGGALKSLRYVWKEADAAPGDDDAFEILPALSSEQSQFLRSLLPLDGQTSAHAFVRLCVGPPGSGKTVVAVDAVQAAQQLRYDVLVLVPSPRLLGTYRSALAGVAEVEEEPFATNPKDEEPKVSVEQVGAFFDALGGPASPREAVRTWWSKVLTLPAVQRWRRDHADVVESRRFLDLLDAVLFDAHAGEGGAKDPLAKQDRPLREAMLALQGGMRGSVQRAKEEGGIVLRWERARAALDRLAAARPGRSLLILADEAQDLIPAEWQALVEGAFRRRTQDVTGLALLGDENQRIAPTAFAWKEVKDFVGGLSPELGNGAGVESTELPQSFRIPRAVAHVANPLVNGAMGGGGRHAPVVDPASIKEVGAVEIVEVADPGTALLEAVGFLADTNLDASARLIVLAAGGVPTHPLVDALDAVEAKGLEWQATVVVGLFEGQADFDAQTRAYTRLTRAQNRVVALVRPSDWASMHRHWEEVLRGDEGQGVSRIAPSELASALRRCLDTSTRVERVGELLDRIANLLDQASHDGSPFPQAALELVVRAIPLGGAVGIPEAVSDYLEHHPAWEEDLRAVTHDGDPRLRVAAALASGDVGYALVLAETIPDLADWVEPLAAAVHASGSLARASAELRRGGGVDASLPELAVAAFQARVVDALRRGAMDDPPVATGPRRVPRRLVQRVEQAVQRDRRRVEAEMEGWERTRRAELDAREAAWRDAVRSSAPARTIREIEDALQGLERALGSERSTE